MNPDVPQVPTAVELFAGCGGLALGVAKAGFSHVLVAERDASASETLRCNHEAGLEPIRSWPIIAGDVADLDYSSLRGSVDLVSGGPPCQPFSIAGAHRGPGDARNMWPQAIRAVRELRPRAFLFENVRGLKRPAFGKYLDFLVRRLSLPEAELDSAGWHKQYAELRRLSGKGDVSSYRVVVSAINSADYGSPQQRHRVIVMGIRADMGQLLAPPRPTHSFEGLVWEKWVTGEYWERHQIPKRDRIKLSDAERPILERILENGRPRTAAWRTVRDAFEGLPAPRVRGESIPNHRLRLGARSYAGHTGSVLDLPAKALKAGDHGVPGGENMLALKSGRVRYFSIREMARLQGLPDEYVITGGWTAAIRQVGNAVPTHVGHTFASVVRRCLAGTVGSPSAT